MKSYGFRPNIILYVAALTSCITVTFAFGRYVFSQITPQIVADLGLSYEFIGRINFLNQGFYLLFSVIGGLASNRLGAIRLISSGTILCALSLILLSFTTNKWLVLGLVSVQGLFTAVSWIPMVESVSMYVPEKNRGLALGAISSGTSYGVILSGFLIPKIISAYDWLMVWRFFGVLGLLLSLFAVYILWSFESRQKPGSQAPGPSTLKAATLTQRGTNRLPSAGFLVIFLVISGIYLVPFQLYLTPLVETDLGGDKNMAGICWGILGFAGLLSGFAGGYLADRLSVKKAMLIAYALSALSILVLVGFKGPAFLYFSCAVFGLVYNAIFGFHPAYLSRILPPEKTAKMFGLFNLALSGGAMAGSYFYGLLGDWTGGFHVSYIVMGGLAAAAVIICLKLADDKPAERR